MLYIYYTTRIIKIIFISLQELPKPQGNEWLRNTILQGANNAIKDAQIFDINF